MNIRRSETTPTPSAVPSPKSHRWPSIWGPRLWALLGLFAVLTLYRVWVVQHSGMSLFFDESQYWDWSRKLDWGFYSKPPLIAALVGLSSSLFGNGVIGVKLVCMLLYPLTALAMVGLARALWPTSGGVRTGVVAGALFITSPLAGILGLAASTDAALLLCWTLASWALWRAQVTDRLSLWLLCGAAVGVGIMDKYTMAAFLLTGLWTLWGVRGPRLGLKRIGPWAAAAVAVLIVSPNIWWNIQNDFPTLQHTAELTTQSSKQGGLGAMLTFMVGQLAALGPLAVVAALLLLNRMSSLGAATLPSSQWAQSTQAHPSSQFSDGPLPPGIRASAMYLASVTSYRYLWAMSLPLLAIAVVQALYADAHVNWAAPALIGLFLLMATRLSPPLVPLAAPRPQKWLLAVLLSNVILTSLVLHARDIGGESLPSKYDIMVRMRGWQEAFDQIAPTMEDPTIKGLPVLADSRLMLTQTAYHWRQFDVRPLAWNPKDTRNNHYEIAQSFKNRIGQDVLLVSANPNPKQVLERFAIVRKVNEAIVPVGPDRQLELHVFFLRGFLGYTEHSYREQSGTEFLNAPSSTP